MLQPFSYSPVSLLPSPETASVRSPWTNCPLSRNSSSRPISKGLTVAFAVEDPKFIGSEYEVTYTDRTEVDFRSDGEWSSVERKYEAVPASVVPAQIQEYVAKSNFPNQYIRKIERNKYTWEIELSNGLEIKFDRQFNVIGFDD